MEPLEVVHLWVPDHSRFTKAECVSWYLQCVLSQTPLASNSNITILNGRTTTGKIVDFGESAQKVLEKGTHLVYDNLGGYFAKIQDAKKEYIDHKKAPTVLTSRTKA